MSLQFPEGFLWGGAVAAYKEDTFNDHAPSGGFIRVFSKNLGF
ncbi:hypothetical protein V8V88_16040 [Paenibacillus phytohabitans]|jgi:beta-glucosidase/6-phospho-beta-glucosidase/beta-galactosidase